jgi:glycosyltransferase involved in cell wall biosynthesis
MSHIPPPQIRAGLASARRNGDPRVAAGLLDERPQLSIIAPAYNEAANIEPLYESIRSALSVAPPWELLIVDDGSSDATGEIVRRLSGRDPRVVGVFLAARRGQTAATVAGLRRARGDAIATIDADLQNDPRDLPAMLQRLVDCDAVVGYRVARRDGFVRRASSRFANAVRNRLTGDSIRDTGCSLKVFRREAILAVPMFEGMHRFLPTLVRYQGYTVVEHPVSHHPRLRGVSKYGIRNRAWRSFKDLLAVRWMRARTIRYEMREERDVR